MKIELIKFKEDDMAFIQKYFSEWFLNPSEENILNSIKKWENELGFCILFNGEKVGITVLTQKPNKCLSWGIMIKDDFRKAGIASESFKLIINEAKKKGFNKVVSSCADDNFPSIKLHEKVGFICLGFEENKSGKKMYRWEYEI